MGKAKQEKGIVAEHFKEDNKHDREMAQSASLKENMEYSKSPKIHRIRNQGTTNLFIIKPEQEVTPMAQLQFCFLIR